MAGTTYGIIAGYDGSASSEQALSWAAREALARGTALTVCHAFGPGFPVPPGEDAVLDLARRSGERVILSGLRQAQHLMGTGEVRSLLIAGSAAAALCERSRDATMVVVGARGLGGVVGLRLGSVGSQVAAHASGRVVVVRGHWRPAAGFVPGPIVVGANGSPPSRDALDFAFEEATLRQAPVLAVCALADAPGSTVARPPAGANDRMGLMGHRPPKSVGNGPSTTLAQPPSGPGGKPSRPGTSVRPSGGGPHVVLRGGQDT